MRSILAVAAALAVIAPFSPAQAEKRVFVIGGDAEGAAIDQCLAHGARCGAAAATAFCKGRAFKHAVSFRKVERDEVTGTVPKNTLCRGNACGDFVAVECAR